MPPQGLQIYLRPCATLTFDLQSWPLGLDPCTVFKISCSQF